MVTIVRVLESEFFRAWQLEDASHHEAQSKEHKRCKVNLSNTNLNVFLLTRHRWALG